MTSPEGPAAALGNIHPALRRAWHPVARSADVGARPVRATLLGHDWVLARLDGAVAAFPDRCPHRLAPLSAGRVDQVAGQAVLRCGYHGWCFTAQGRCTEIPALGASDHLPPRSGLDPPAGVTERYGMVWLAVEPPMAPLPEIPEFDDGRFARSDMAVRTAAVGAGLMMDNFLDTAHFPFVHAATIGLPDDPRVEEAVIDRGGLGFVVRYEHEFDNHTDPGVAVGERPLRQRRRLEYRYQAPFAINLRIEEIDAARTSVIVLFVQPAGTEGCFLYTVVLRSGGPVSDADMADALAYELAILGEDLALQERFTDLSLPLDLTTECHTRADRVTVELRRVLAEFAGHLPGRPRPAARTGQPAGRPNRTPAAALPEPTRSPA